MSFHSSLHRIYLSPGSLISSVVDISANTFPWACQKSPGIATIRVQMDADTIELGIRATSGNAAQISPLENSEPPNSDTYNFSQRQQFSLPPVDGGRDAWLFLAAAFMVETLVWGANPSLQSNEDSIANSHGTRLPFRVWCLSGVL